MIQFGPWLPDQPDYSNPGVTRAENVVPAAMGYRSLPEFVAYSDEASGNINGVFAAKDNDGNVKLFAGDNSKLYELDTTDSSLDNISKAGNYTLTTPKDRWRFAQFGKDVIAVGGLANPVQKYTLGTSSLFADLGGSPPDADFVTVVRDFVWLGRAEDGSGNRVPYRVHWSGFNDPTYTTGVAMYEAGVAVSGEPPTLVNVSTATHHTFELAKDGGGNCPLMPSNALCEFVHGTSYCVTVRAHNLHGGYATNTSSGMRVCTQGPSPGNVSDGTDMYEEDSELDATNQPWLHITWAGFDDSCAMGVAHYSVQVQRRYGQSYYSVRVLERPVGHALPIRHRVVRSHTLLQVIDTGQHFA